MRGNTLFSVFLLLIAGASAACGSSGSSDHREFRLQGQILTMGADHKEASIKHEEIQGFMPAMTMSYKVRDATQYEGLAPGDLVNATLVVVSNDAYLTDVRKVGAAPIEKPAPDTGTPTASSGFELLKEGQPVPNASFVDQNGRKRDIESFRGSAVAVTFIYTKCPLPTFCPLMDRHFKVIQDKIQATPSLDVKLLSISFDPVTDTPPVLRRHARELGADPKIWTFFTGDRDEIDHFAARFGVTVARALNDPRDITHTLRTAIIDRQGNLVKVYVGNEWTPDQLLADIKALVGVD